MPVADIKKGSVENLKCYRLSPNLIRTLGFNDLVINSK